MNRVIGATALAGGTALLLAGCGTTYVAPGASGPSAPVTIRPSAPVTASSPSALKPASERVPSAATAVTIAARPGLVVGAKSPAPVTITDASTVRRIGSLVDGLPLFPRGVLNCPADMGQAIQLTFRSGSGGPVLASVTAGVAGCQGVIFLVDGKPQPSLAGGASLAREVLALAGLHWTGYSGGMANGIPVTSGVMSRG